MYLIRHENLHLICVTSSLLSEFYMRLGPDAKQKKNFLDLRPHFDLQLQYSRLSGHYDDAQALPFPHRFEPLQIRYTTLFIIDFNRFFVE